MTEFLLALTQALSALNLYDPGHPARERAQDLAFQKLEELLFENPECSVTFLSGEVVVGGRPLPGLDRWTWGRRFEKSGVQRIEVVGPVPRGAFVRFIEQLHHHLGRGPRPESSREDGMVGEGPIRFGSLGLVGERRNPADPSIPEYTLQEETDALRWVLDQLREGEDLDMVEVEFVVRSPMAAMHAGDRFLIPLLRMRDHDQYTTTHSLNVAVLSMALAEFMGVRPREVQGIGVAGVLHDIGKVKVDQALLVKPGRLTFDEREAIQRHPVEGARLLMDSDEGLELAAIVAYEHHIWYSGGGYPTVRYPRKCHPASQLLHVCDVFDAFATHRPYRDAWEQSRIIDYIREGSGTEFDPAFALPFIRMMERWAPQVAMLSSPRDPVPLVAALGG